MSTFEVTAPAPWRPTTPPVVLPVRPVEAAPQAVLDPAFRIDIGGSDAGRGDPSGAAIEDQGRSRGNGETAKSDDERRITIDRDTKSVVYQVLDPGTGTVLVQVPDVSVLRSRAYADAQAARKAIADKPVDREA